jgi:hypothetical protein
VPARRSLDEVVPSKCPERERDGGSRDDDVQRHEEERVLVPEVNRHAKGRGREGEDRQNGRIPGEPRPHRNEKAEADDKRCDADGRRNEPVQIVRRDERPAQDRLGGHEHREAEEESSASPQEEEDPAPATPDEGRDLRGGPVTHGAAAVTTTVARSSCPRRETTSR